MDWGLLGVERLGGVRRSRTLGLGGAVRSFNELAVPGLGGVWFGRQVILALLGIHLAESAREGGRGPSNIATANAVEALAVWSTLSKNGWSRDPRLPGSLKLRRQNVTAGLSFEQACSRSFYVSQPMRIGTRDALAMLGLVKGTTRRFNGYAVTELGRALLEATCPAARNALSRWVIGAGPPFRRIDEIDPTKPLPDRAREIIRGAFVSGSDFDRGRRRQALAFVEGLRARSEGHTAWDRQPAEIHDREHWADMRAGASLAGVIDAAAGDPQGGSVLGRVEARMGAAELRRLALADALDVGMRPALDRLWVRARAFLDAGHDPSPGRVASRFCAECGDADPAVVLARLLARDGNILRLDVTDVRAGPAFKGHPVRDWEAEGGALDPVDDDVVEEAPANAVPPLPEGMSIRIRNLAALAPDLQITPATASGT